MIILSDMVVDLLEKFQEYSGKKVQRLFKLASNICSFYALGWMRLERMVEVKELLSIRSIMGFDNKVCIKTKFLEWVRHFYDNPEQCKDKIYRSPVFDLLVIACDFGLDSVFRDFVDGHPILLKKWLERGCMRTWELESTYWSIQALTLASLNLLDDIRNNR